MDWKGNSMVFKGYATGTGKKATMKVKDAQLLSWDDVQGNQSFGAILNQDFVDISFDTDELSQKFWDMAEKNNWNCLILENPENGHIHSYWKDTEHRIEKGGKDKKLAVGLIADIHSGSTYIPLRVNGVDRFPPSFEPDDIDEVPDELLPVNTTINLADLQEGDGRNDELFKYILILQSQLMLDREPIRRVLDNINHFIFQDALSEEEMDVITRDDAFAKPIFYKGKTFLHNAFGQYMKNEYHIKRIQGQLHVYDGGIYKSGYRFIESKMVELIPTLKANHRVETLKYLEIITPEETQVADANLIAFRNGLYDLATDELLPFSPDHVITNMIPWDYKSALDTAISNAKTAKSNLDTSTSTGNTAKNNLDTAISNATKTRSDLNAVISSAQSAQSSLSGVIAQASTAQTNLQNATNSARGVCFRKVEKRPK